MRFISGLTATGFALMLTASADSQAIVASQQLSSTKAVTNRKLVSVELKNVTLERAVEEIVAQAGVRVTYGKEVTSSRRQVTLNLSNVTVEKAMSAALNSTGLIAVMMPDGDEFVIRPARGSNAFAQGVITGKVMDARSGKGIAGATVSSSNDARSASTAEDGSYRLRSITAGMHTISVRRVGYAKQTRSVSIGEGATVTADFKLEPGANVLDQVVVTGTVTQTELKAVPNAITVVTAKEIEERGITRIDQLFRGDIPGLFAVNLGGNAELDQVIMFSRGATTVGGSSAGTVSTNPGDIPASGLGRQVYTNPIKTYIDGVEMADARYMSQIDPRSIERIEILTGPQASTIYGSNALNGVMQIFTKRGNTQKPQILLNFLAGFVQNNFTSALAPSYSTNGSASGVEGRLSYNVGGSVDYAGAWAPGKNTIRYSSNGGARMVARQLSVDLSGRNGLTQNRQGGEPMQRLLQRSQTGVYRWGALGSTIPTQRNTTGRGNTLGIKLGYRPVSWWSHDISIGKDGIYTEFAQMKRTYGSRSDTVLFINQATVNTTSSQYTTTASLPVLSFGSLQLTSGWDHTRSTSMSTSARPLALTGTLANPGVIRGIPAKNQGAFAQGQFGIGDALFLTYGLRVEWNPNFGSEASPNFAPRYGVSYTRDVGSLTTKLRGSYGRSTRPPIAKTRDGTLLTSDLLTMFGPTYDYLPNPNLGPEHQQGGEGGLELYFANRGSLVVTRYNQTVDNLILPLARVDSVISLIQNDPMCNNWGLPVNADGYCYYNQGQQLNVANIRNQGWEMQGTVNFGPLTTRGTYSWTKSRVIGVTEKYSALANYIKKGAPFDFMAEHTWALNLSYAVAANRISLSVNGIGQVYNAMDNVQLATAIQQFSTVYRIPFTAQRWDLPSDYHSKSGGYATVDLNAARQLSSKFEGTLQVNNLTDYYRVDFDSRYPTAGRNTKLGLRWRM